MHWLEYAHACYFFLASRLTTARLDVRMMISNRAVIDIMVNAILESNTEVDHLALTNATYRKVTQGANSCN